MKLERSFEKSYVGLMTLFLLLFMISMYLLMSDQLFLFTWVAITLNSVVFEMSFICDFISFIFASVVMYISMSVFIFSEDYMTSEKYKSRFNLLLVLFVLSMSFMIFIPNLITLLLGWDGLGLVSFLLIVYYQSSSSMNAGMLTALTNRVGDVFLLFSIVIFFNMGQWNILFNDMYYYMGLICFGIMIAGMTKSAQVPFSSWLPAAMAAPTPVSALVHSSTLVTAGIYLFIRFSSMFMKSFFVKELFFFIGSLTMIMAGIMALTEYDMKKIIALSTLSQLGLMVLTIGMNFTELVFFHLLTHAMFKALFFVCAGTLIHSYYSTQDMRMMGSSFNDMPIVSINLLISMFALCGMPFLAGYYSKDLIIEMLLLSNFSVISIFFIMVGTALTIMYSLKFFYFLVFKESLIYARFFLSDVSGNSLVSMCILSMGAIFSGCLFSWIFFNMTSTVILSSFLKNFTWIFVLFMFLSSLLGMKVKIGGMFFFWLRSMCFLIPLTSRMFPLVVLNLSKNSMKVMDQGWLEIMGPQGMYFMILENSKMLLILQKKNLLVFLTLIFFLSIYLSVI